eukprot:2559674-Rhodomonas_salina.1
MSTARHHAALLVPNSSRARSRRTHGTRSQSRGVMHHLDRRSTPNTPPLHPRRLGTQMHGPHCPAAWQENFRTYISFTNPVRNTCTLVPRPLLAL